MEVVPLVGAGEEAKAGGDGEGDDGSFDEIQLLRGWRRKHDEEKHALNKKTERYMVLFLCCCQKIP